MELPKSWCQIKVTGTQEQGMKRKQPNIIIKQIIYKKMVDTEINIEKIVDLILGLDSPRGGGYTLQWAELCGVRNN